VISKVLVPKQAARIAMVTTSEVSAGEVAAQKAGNGGACPTLGRRRPHRQRHARRFQSPGGADNNITRIDGPTRWRYTGWAA